MSRSNLGPYLGNAGGENFIYPLKFWFCENWSSALPLCALEYQDVELHIFWQSNLPSPLASTLAKSDVSTPPTNLGSWALASVPNSTVTAAPTAIEFASFGNGTGVVPSGTTSAKGDETALTFTLIPVETGAPGSDTGTISATLGSIECTATGTGGWSVGDTITFDNAQLLGSGAGQANFAGVTDDLVLTVTEANAAVFNSTAATGLVLTTDYTTTSVNGSGAVFTLAPSGGTLSTTLGTITPTTLGTGYRSGDTFTFLEAKIQSYFGALSTGDLVITITSSSLGDPRYQCHANFAFLDEVERKDMSTKPADHLITQVQRLPVNSSVGLKRVPLSFTHPVKYLASTAPVLCDTTDGVNNLFKLVVNGTDIGKERNPYPHFTQVPQYYNCPYWCQEGANDLFIYPFCLDTSKMQPTGALNMSRTSNTELVSNLAITHDIYAVSYNIFRTEKGLGATLYAN